MFIVYVIVNNHRQWDQMHLEILKSRIRNALPAKKVLPILSHDGELFEVDNFAISRFICKKIIPYVGCHPFPLTELALMVSAVCRLSPELIFDWGTNLGKSAWIFSTTTNFFSLKTHIHTIDLPPEGEHVEHPKNKVGAFIRGKKNVTQHFGDGVSVAIQLASLQLQKQKNSHFLFFLDGDHSLETVSRELQLIHESFPLASILVHDTFFQEESAHYNIGPWRAVDNFIKSTQGQYQILTTATGLPGMTLLYPKVERIWRQ